jgi:hypothetical protein
MMKFVLVLCLLGVVANAVSMKDFRAWAARYHKHYTRAEEARRYIIWKANVADAERMNREGRHGAKFGPTMFSDLTRDEFRATRTTRLIGIGKGPKPVVPDRSASGVKDTKDYSYMLPGIKDQGNCGSCWAFSAVANMEAQTYLKHGEEVVSLSEQELVSCNIWPNLGCNGGNMDAADEYAIENGMTTTEEYPYKSGKSGKTGECLDFTPQYFFETWKAIGKTDKAIMDALNKYGPLSIAVEADRDPFYHYTGGIIDSDDCGEMLNHGIALVGYGTEDGVDYWLVRNSWSEAWGEQGTARLVRGKNMCGMNSEVTTIVA